jgi:hypothetical protein
MRIFLHWITKLHSTANPFLFCRYSRRPEPYIYKAPITYRTFKAIHEFFSPAPVSVQEPQTGMAANRTCGWQNENCEPGACPRIWRYCAPGAEVGVCRVAQPREIRGIGAARRCAPTSPPSLCLAFAPTALGTRYILYSRTGPSDWFSGID